MTSFYSAPRPAQSALLIALFLVLLFLPLTAFFSYESRRARWMLWLNFALFALFSVPLALLTDAFRHGLAGLPAAHILPLPLWAFWGMFAATAALLAAESVVLLRLRRRTLSRSAVKQAMDTLPDAICYFGASGRIKLCNLQMQRLCLALTGRDLQTQQELLDALLRCRTGGPVRQLSDERQTYRFPDGTVWRYAQSAVTTQDGAVFTEARFSDVTTLYEKHLELKAQTRQLRRIAVERKRLSEQVLELTREREILAAKTRLHDQMGVGLTAIRQLLQQEAAPEDADRALHTLRRTVEALKRDNESPLGRDAASELMQDAAAIGTQIELHGALPQQERARRVLLLAMRECLTNAARHADATLLRVELTHTPDAVTARITNNGTPPHGVPTPKGGLLNLQRHIIDCGGRMTLQADPEFCLTVTVPCKEEST